MSERNAEQLKSIRESEVKMREDLDKIDLQIEYEDHSFEDKRSKITFVRWHVKTIAY